MSELLASAISEFLDRLGSERQFDAPLLALLRLEGFFDIHFLHGPFEFGKDFVAKRSIDGRRHQYTFQSKLGDIDKNVWTTQVQPQCESMAFTSIGHPSFDPTLERRMVVVATGRLVGQARILAQEYQQSLKPRRLPPLEIWEREDLVAFLSADACLGTSFAWTEFGKFVWDAECTDATPSIAEAFSRRWIRPVTQEGVWRAVLEYAIVRDELDARGLGFHGFRLSLGLVRVVATADDELADSAQETEVLYELLRREVRRRADALYSWFSTLEESNKDVWLLAGDLSDIVQVSARALLMLEVVALDLFASASLGELPPFAANRLVTELLSVEASSRPLSDDYAVSVLVGGTVASALGVDPGAWLAKVAAWVGEAYAKETGIGLERAGAGAESELWRTMASIVENPNVTPRRESMLASAVLDACSVCELTSAYSGALATMSASNVVPYRLIPQPKPGEFDPGRAMCWRIFAGEYPREWEGLDGWKNGEPHKRADVVRRFDTRGLHWVGVAIALLVRDRWWLHSLRQAYLQVRR